MPTTRRASSAPSLGAHGAFLVTNFWEHFSGERELKQAAAMARATKAAGVAHAVWSTLEDTRLSFPLDDPRLKTLQGKYKVPHFDAKGEADAIFAAEAAPTSYLMVAFYWENFIYFGQGPRKGADGNVVLALPLGGGKLPGIAAEDIGRCAYGIFRRGPEVAGQRFGVAGEVLSGPEYAAAFSRHLGVPVSFYDMPFDDYRALGFPGADDMGTCTSTTPSSARSSAAMLPRGRTCAESGAPVVRPLAERECIAHPARLRRRCQHIERRPPVIPGRPGRGDASAPSASSQARARPGDGDPGVTHAALATTCP